jgi:hypothetical protein
MVKNADAANTPVTSASRQLQVSPRAGDITNHSGDNMTGSQKVPDNEKSNLLGM